MSAKRKKIPRRSFRTSLGARWLVFLIALAALTGTGYYYRSALRFYYFKIRGETEKELRLHDIRNFEVLSAHRNFSAGIDVSEYQGKINWHQVDSIAEMFPIDFVYIRASAGKDRPDRAYAENYQGARKAGFICGAYHYYRPDENSLEQANLFIKTVKRSFGDLPPVLDIEQLPESQPVDSLRMGVRRWLTMVEKHYGIRPVIYTGEKFYEDFLKEEFGDNYVFWIANYNFTENQIGSREIWQFTEKGLVPGIIGRVDVNLYNGNLRQLLQLTKSTR